MSLSLLWRAMNDVDWPVLPHGSLEKLAENLWRVQGDMSGAPIKRVMAIARTGDGRLALHSAIALDEKTMREVEALGEPAVLLVPNAFHRIDAPRFARRYPKMRILCPHGSRAKIAERVRVDGTYEEGLGDDTVRLEHLDGVGDLEGVVRVRSDDGTTLVFNDIVFNMPHAAGLGGLALRLLGSSGGPRLTSVARTFLVKDRRALRARLIALANGTPDLRRIVVSHHETIVVEPAEVLRQVATTL
jgi:hypothetical protein